MLRDFFRLNDNPGFRELDTEAFLNHFQNANSLKNARLKKGDGIARKRFKDYQFENVDMSHCEFKQVTFTGCSFTDCLFIGTTFYDCEFHRANFLDCNTYKFNLEKTYISPASFILNAKYITEAPNVGVDLFQQLFTNASNAHQIEHASQADIMRRRWRRWQIEWEVRRAKGVQLATRVQTALDWFYDKTTTYGYGPGRFALFSTVILCAISETTVRLWPFLGMTQNGSSLSATACPAGWALNVAPTSVETISFFDGLYNFLLLMTTLGIGERTPTTALGKGYVVLSALLGVVWFSVFTAILIRRIIR